MAVLKGCLVLAGAFKVSFLDLLNIVQNKEATATNYMGFSGFHQCPTFVRSLKGWEVESLNLL